MRSDRILSNSFAMQDVRLIGLNELSIVGGFWGFRIGMMVASFHDCGVVAEKRERLNNCKSLSRAFGPRCFRRFGEIASGPGALLGLVL